MFVIFLSTGKQYHEYIRWIATTQLDQPCRRLQIVAKGCLTKLTKLTKPKSSSYFDEFTCHSARSDLRRKVRERPDSLWICAIGAISGRGDSEIMMKIKINICYTTIIQSMRDRNGTIDCKESKDSGWESRASGRKHDRLLIQNTMLYKKKETENFQRYIV